MRLVPAEKPDWITARSRLPGKDVGLVKSNMNITHAEPEEIASETGGRVNLDLIISCEAHQARFNAKIDRSAGEDGCWPWCASCNDEGYGNFWLGGRSAKAHRVAYRLHKGPVPDELLVMHSCDNPPCCNPRHLSLGTDLDNAADKYAKSRANHATGERNGCSTHPERLKRGDENGSRKHPEKLVRGENHWTALRPDDVVMGEDVHTAVLTIEDVMEMRKLVRDGHSAPTLAKRFGVATATAHAALTGKSWAHLPGAIPKLPKKSNLRVRGEDMNTAKLKEAQVIEIRAAYAKAKMEAGGGRTRIAYALAEKYGVSRGMICRIVSRKCWAHVP